MNQPYDPHLFFEKREVNQKIMMQYSFRIFKKTNELRFKENIGTLEWSKQLSDLAMSHCRDLALNRVPFGNEGLDERIKQMTFPHINVFENVACSKDRNDLPEVLKLFMI